MDKKLIIGVLVAIVLTSGFFWVTRPDRLIQTTVDGKTVTVGALAGPDIASPYLRWGGVAEYRYSQPMNVTSLGGANGSTTPCAIQSPAATSSLQFFSASAIVATGTAADLSLAKSTTAYATTSPLLTNFTVAASTDFSLVYDAATSSASSTLPQGRMIFAPNTYLVLGAKGASGPNDRAGYQWTGVCQAIFNAVE